MYRRPAPRFHDARRFRVPSRSTQAVATTTFFEQRIREERQECPTCLERKMDEDLIPFTEVRFWNTEECLIVNAMLAAAFLKSAVFEQELSTVHLEMRISTSSKEPISLNAICSFKHFEEPKVPGVLSEGQTAVGSLSSSQILKLSHAACPPSDPCKPSGPCRTAKDCTAAVVSNKHCTLRLRGVLYL
jgi:hypothetical protein